MKVLNIKGNKVSFDFTQDEYDMLLRYGMQLYIDKEHGKNKVKVLPITEETIVNEFPTKKYELPDVLANEFLSMAVNQALLNMVERLEKEDNIKPTGEKKSKKSKKVTPACWCEHANEHVDKCKCPSDCSCKLYSCKNK